MVRLWLVGSSEGLVVALVPLLGVGAGLLGVGVGWLGVGGLSVSLLVVQASCLAQGG